MSSRKNPEHRKRSDPWRIPVLCLYLAALLWIAYDLYDGIMARQEVVRRVDAAVSLTNADRHRQALISLLELQNEWGMRQRTPAELVLQKFRPFSPELAANLSVIHEELAVRFGNASVPDLAARNYMLALMHDPSRTRAAKDFAQECFIAKNYELGWISAKLAVANSAGPGAKAFATDMTKYFAKRYTGPKYEELP